METEILIFDIPEVEPIINKSQKEIEYDQLRKDSIISKWHFDLFYDMEVMIDIDRLPDSNISSVISKWLLRYFTPIVTLTDVTNFVLVQSDISIIAICDDNYVVIGKDTSMKLIGFKPMDLCYKLYDKYQLVHYDHISIHDLALSGCYAMTNLQTNRYTQQRHELNHYGDIRLDNDRLLFTGEDEKLLQMLMSYVSHMTKYYGENYLTALIELRLAYKSHQYKTLPWLFEYNKHITSNMDKIQQRPSNNYTIDSYIQMEVENVISYYYYGKYLGVDNSIFKRITNDRILTDSESATYAKLINDTYAKKLTISKMQTIAFNKYATDDLSSLDKKQIAVITVIPISYYKFISLYYLQAKYFSLFFINYSIPKNNY